MSQDEYKRCPNEGSLCFCPGTCQEKVDSPEKVPSWARPQKKKNWPRRTSAPWKLGGP